MIEGDSQECLYPQMYNMSWWARPGEDIFCQSKVDKIIKTGSRSESKCGEKLICAPENLFWSSKSWKNQKGSSLKVSQIDSRLYLVRFKCIVMYIYACKVHFVGLSLRSLLSLENHAYNTKFSLILPLVTVNFSPCSSSNGALRHLSTWNMLINE